MKTTWTSLVLAVALATCSAGLAQETLPPIPISGGQTTKYAIDDQFLTISATGVAATVQFEVVSSERVAGTVTRTSSGTTRGSVQIRWDNQDRTASLWLDATSPQAAFEMRSQPRRRFLAHRD